jgi:hypothetical protein
MFIAPGEYVFKSGGKVSRLLGHVVSLTWTMVSRANGPSSPPTAHADLRSARHMASAVVEACAEPVSTDLGRDGRSGAA